MNGGVDHYELDRLRGDLEDSIRRLERRLDDVERSDREARRELFRDLADGLAEVRDEVRTLRESLRKAPEQWMPSGSGDDA